MPIWAWLVLAAVAGVIGWLLFALAFAVGARIAEHIVGQILKAFKEHKL